MGWRVPGMNLGAMAGRRCLACDTIEPVAGLEPVWPLDWRCPTCGHATAERDGIAMFAPELADTVSGVDPKGFAALSRVEDDHFWFVARRELIVGLTRKYFPKACKLVEIGCGTGAVLRELAASRHWERLVGSELHPSGLNFARRRLPSGVEFVQMDARQIPAANLFDLTGAFDVIEHIADDEAVLRGMRAATELGGGIIIAVPQHPWLWSSADDFAHHQRRYKRGELEDKMRRSGYEILFSSSFTAWLLPLMAISRLIRKGKAAGVDAYEFAPSPIVNRALTAILRAEVWMTLAGWRWPAGGSRIVVGRAV